MTVPLHFIRRLIERGLLLVLMVWAPVSRADGGPPAPASPAPSSSGKSAAESRFEAGVAAYEDGRYREAIERFKEADQLAPSPLLSFNIAKVYERMFANREALAAYRDYLRRLPHAENRAAVSQRIHELEQALRATGVQQLTVLSTPAGARVWIDNLSRGLTPWTGELIPGPHTLALRSSGYRDAVSEIELPAERAIDIELPLVPEPTRPPVVPQAPAAAAGAGRGPRIAYVAPFELVPPPLASDEVTWVPRWWTWAMFGGSAAALVGAGSFELLRSRSEREARDSQVQVEHEARYEAMQDRQTLARMFLGAGVLAALAGGVSLYFDFREAAASPDDVAFMCGSTGCVLAAKGLF